MNTNYDSNGQYQEVYGDVAERFEEAFNAFKRTYELQYPAPVMPENAERVLGWKQAGMFTGLIGSVIVSASHTIPIFVGTENVTPLTIFIGIAVFVMIELGIVVFAYSSTEQQYKTREDIRTRVKNFTRTGLYFIVGIAVVANTIYVVGQNITIPDDTISQNIWSAVLLVTFLAIGISAPVIAFLTGEILAVDVLEHQSRYNRLLEKYQGDLLAWQVGLNSSWSNQKRKWGASIDIESRVKRLSNTSEITMSNVSASLSTQTDNRQTGHGYNRVSSAVDIALEYLRNNPESANLTVRELGENAGVGKDSAAKARKIFLGE